VPPTLECVVNVSEGRDERVLADLAAVCASALLDLHRDPDHHRSVYTLGGPADVVESAVPALAAAAVGVLDISEHQGRHPRIGVVDVVPFAPLTPGTWEIAVGARDRFARWASAELALPCFLYGPLPGGGTRTLPEIRRRAFVDLDPDSGPHRPHPTAGASAVGARPVLVAYNVWVEGGDLSLARSAAAAIRGPAVRSLGFDLADGVQVSCNLVDPLTVGPAEVHDEIDRLLKAGGALAGRCELVGLMPAAVLANVPASRWRALNLGPETTIEARLEALGLARP
jgi:glutamate formiminotransferase